MGGGHLMVTACNTLLKNKNKFSVFTSLNKLNSKIIDKNYTLRDYFNKYKINYHILRNLNDLNKKKYQNIFKKKNNIVGLVLSLEFIFKKNHLKLFNDKIYNFHGSYLPDMKGGGGWTWLMLMNKYDAGNSIHKINEYIDDGDIIVQEKYIFPKKYRTSLKAMHSYGKIKQNQFLISFLNKIFKSKLKHKPIKQKLEKSIYFPKLNTFTDGIIDWNWHINDILIFIKAFGKPYCGASSSIIKNRLFILKARKKLFKSKFHPFQYGRIINVYKEKIYISCRGGILVVTEYNFKKSFSDLKVLIGKKLSSI